MCLHESLLHLRIYYRTEKILGKLADKFCAFSNTTSRFIFFLITKREFNLVIFKRFDLAQEYFKLN
jgi:hypothetical protein